MASAPDSDLIRYSNLGLYSSVEREIKLTIVNESKRKKQLALYLESHLLSNLSDKKDSLATCRSKFNFIRKLLL